MLRQTNFCNLDVADLNAERKELLGESRKHTLCEFFAQVVHPVVCNRINKTANALLNLGGEKFVETSSAKLINKSLSIVNIPVNAKSQRQIDVDHHVVCCRYLTGWCIVCDRCKRYDMTHTHPEWPARMNTSFKLPHVLVPTLVQD